MYDAWNDVLQYVRLFGGAYGKNGRLDVAAVRFVFVICGAELDLKVFTDFDIVIIGVVYILARAIGKYFGAYGSAKMMKCDEKVTKNLGITLLPQAGVALGMSITAKQLGDVDGALVRNIILFSVLILELIGPTLTKNALIRAGDVIPENAVSSRRRNAPVDDDD